MAVTSAFYDAVNAGRVQSVRIMMKDSLLVDPTFEEFKDMESISKAMKDLYDIHDGREFITDKTQWDDHYMDKQMVQVVGNFSHERIAHLKDVVRYLRPVSQTIQETKKTGHRQTTKSAPKNKAEYQREKQLDQQEGRYLGSKMATGAVIGAVAGGIIASVAGTNVIGGAVIGGVAGGAVVYVAVNGDN